MDKIKFANKAKFPVVFIFTILSLACARQGENGASTMAAGSFESLQKAKVARIWRGRTEEARADEYEKYLYEEGIKKIAATPGNFGVQVMRRTKGGIAEFTTISYWASREDIKRYAGGEIEKPHHLPKDKDYLLELPEFVENCDLKINDWK